MGYMGFGMRKEVYQRKPKKAFEKINELYGDDKANRKHNPKIKGPSREDIFNKQRTRSLGDIKFFKILKIAVLTALLSLAIYVFFIGDMIHQYQVNRLKTGLIENFNQDHEWLLDRIDRMPVSLYIKIDSSQQNILHMKKGFSSWVDGKYQRMPEYSLSIAHKSFTGLKAKNGLIYIEMQDTTITLSENWSLILGGTLEAPALDQHVQDFLLNAKEIQMIKNKLRGLKIKHIVHENHKTMLPLSKTKGFGNYYYIKSATEQKESKFNIKIKDNFHLIKSNY